MHNYLVTLVDRVTGEHQQVIVRSECPHGMQQYIDWLIEEGNSPVRLANPVVIDVDDHAARHIPVRHRI